jgi:hypothetical protein
MFSKIVVLYEIYSKKLQWPNTFGMWHISVLNTDTDNRTIFMLVDEK